jgi:hypothetical protein
MVYEFKYGKKPIRIKPGETFSVKITPPMVDCPCGTKWESLRLVSYKENNKPQCFIRCPGCDRRGTAEESAVLATLAWGGMLSREERKET